VNRDQIIAVMARVGSRRFEDKKHGWIDFNCPFAAWGHGGGIDKDPSFGVKVDAASGYFCRSCGARGLLVTLPGKLAKRHGPSHHDYVMLMELSEEIRKEEFDGTFRAEWVTEEVESAVVDVPLDPAIWDNYYEPLESSPEALWYLAEGRTIEEPKSLPFDWRVLKGLGCGFYPDHGRIMFPIRDRDNLWGYAGRSTRKAKIKVWNTPGFRKELHILGQHLWKPGLPTIVVEGLFAYARLHALGIACAGNIGAIMGSSISETQATLVGNNAHLWLDNDLAGMQGIHGAPDGHPGAKEILYRRGAQVTIPTWPADKRDPDELTREEALTMLGEKSTDSFRAAF
jgi:hypothetical protein